MPHIVLWHRRLRKRFEWNSTGHYHLTEPGILRYRFDKNIVLLSFAHAFILNWSTPLEVNDQLCSYYQSFADMVPNISFIMLLRALSEILAVCILYKLLYGTLGFETWTYQFGCVDFNLCWGSNVLKNWIQHNLNTNGIL